MAKTLENSGMSSIYMWAYTGENIFSSSSSKFFPGVISHMFLKGGVQDFKNKMTTRVVEHLYMDTEN